MRSRKVLKCCCASTVVGTSTATCLPSITALNAARMATSVLPKPTSPQISRSIGLGRSMSALVSTMARIWSGVSSKMKALSNSRCQGVSGANGWPGLRFARGLDGEQFAGDIAHGAFGLRLGLGPARAAQRVERRTRLAGADVFADQVRLGDRHVELGRRLRGIARRVFDDQAFLRRHSALAAVPSVGLVPAPIGSTCRPR